MARNILIDQNFNGAELQNFTLQNLAVAPANPKEGQPYFNTVEQRAKIYENGEWRNLTAEEAKSWQVEIDQAKADAVQEAKTYTDEQIKAFKPAEVNYNEKLAEVLRIQDPTINRLVKDISQLSEDEKRAITDPVKQELENKITEKIDGLIDGASEDLNTLKELGEAVKQAGNITEAVKTKADIAKATLSNEPTGVHTVAHNLDSEDVIVAVYDANKNEVFPDVAVIDANTVRITALAGLDLTGYKVVIVG